MGKCTECGANAGLMMSLCANCIAAGQEASVEKYRLEKSQSAELDALAQAVVLTTAPSIEGFRIAKTLEIVTSECAFGMNIFSDIATALSDVFGGRSETIQRSLRDARKVCLHELKKEAALIGANAVVAVDLDYSQFSGAGKSMLFLVASGTAVHALSLGEPDGSTR